MLAWLYHLCGRFCVGTA